MLEKWYWIAGIVVAFVAVINFFFRSNRKKSVENRQIAKVSGQNNTVSQASKVKMGKRKDPQ